VISLFRKILFYGIGTDARTAISLQLHGVTEFATANVKDFQAFGFSRVWNPLVA